MFDDIKRGMKRGFLEQSMVKTVERNLGYRAKNVKMKNGKLTADPTQEFIDECGSEEKADKIIDRRAKKALQNHTKFLGNKAHSMGKISNTQLKELKEKTKKELKE